MNKIIFVALFFSSLFSFSQEKTNKSVVYYTEIESPFLGNRNGAALGSCLIFSKTESSYVTKKDSLSAIMQTEQKEMYENAGSGQIELNMNGVSTYKNGFQVYTDLKKDTVWSSTRWDKYAFIKEKKEVINWELLNETKKIAAFECHKAQAKFRGRTYTAWYTNEIPVPFGPWKLQGLPGLILEAYDVDGAFYYCMRKIEYPTHNPTPFSKVVLEDGKKWLSVKEYLDWCDNNLQKAYEKGILLGITTATKGTRKQTFKEISE